MIKKTVLVVGICITSLPAWAQMLIHVQLSSSRKSEQQSVVIEDNQIALCTLDDLCFEIATKRDNQNVNMNVNIFTSSRANKTLIAKPEFKTELGTPAHLALERDGEQMDLTIVAVDVV